MIPDRLFTAHLKVFNMANLFDRPMVLLNLPVLVMNFREVVAFKRDLFWQKPRSGDAGLLASS